MSRAPFSRLAIVGAHGKMGALFAARCEAAGMDVARLDRPLTEDTLARGLAGAELVCLSVPAQAVAAVTALLAAFIKPPAVLIDLCSVKTLPLRDMLDGYDGPVVGTHPLFGPVPPVDAPNRVALVQGREQGHPGPLTAVADWTQRLGFTPFTTTAAEHDTAMAYIQGLNFVTTVAYLAAKPNNLELSRFITPSFTRRLDAAKKLVLEDAPLFTALIEANPHAQDLMRSFTRYLGIAAGGDIDLLVGRASRWWEKNT
ncbi:MAG: prephenate dehydrogenase/arogenate dehydrogenase family protein [Desulfovibrionaceae bacterium]|nr:prephenate dehydrogenase/arogenate dehydrogenase family protein [Desulfovibrionaceae bacterium]MBF0514677.1 prephenate dehydrogenase/arogenate dehydrogenase family protein [Desulfovibrionaceae bacterium]